MWRLWQAIRVLTAIQEDKTDTCIGYSIVYVCAM
jgi:hypothetical protein